jgi:ABC-type amino acid transport substrate-binding protein
VEKNIGNATLITTQDYDEGVRMVLENEVDLMVADMTICILSAMRHRESGLTTLNAPLNMEPIGIAVSPQDDQFAKLIGNYLQTFEGAGILEKLRKKWMENDSWINSSLAMPLPGLNNCPGFSRPQWVLFAMHHPVRVPVVEQWLHP